MNRTFKIVGRHKQVKDQPSWCRGIAGRQAKKRVYTSKADFDKYSPELLERWNRCYDVEVFELINASWFQQ